MVKYFKVIVAVCAIFLIEICAEKIVMQMNVSAEIDKDKVMIARINSRIQGIAKQFGKLRMVIGGPCSMWGIDAEIEHELKSAGMDVICWPNAPLLDPEGSWVIRQDLMMYNIIIFGDSFYTLIQPDSNTGEIPKRITDQIPLLRRFLEAGGGIWFSGIGEQNWGKSSYALNYILKELNLDAEVAGEVVMDTAVMKEGSRLGDYAWVEVLSDPLTEGVRNLLHPSGVIGAEGSMGVVPIVNLSSEWRLLMKGKSTSASFPHVEGNPSGKLLTTPGIIKSSPMLVAVRQAGKGRVVLWPTWSNFTVTGGSGGKLIDGEKNGIYSDGARLIENLLYWLAEPNQKSKNVGTFDPEKTKAEMKGINVDEWLKNWSQPGRKDYSNQYKGLIGAHSNLSDGKSSPEEMIEVAKKAGYDFIAFTEDFSQMDEEKWRKLLSVCDSANAADSNFIAYPGLDFMDEAGNRGVHFGNRYWIKDEWRSKEDKNRIRWWYNLAYQASADANAWLPRVIIRSKTNNKRPWNQGLWNLFGAFCYEKGNLVDDSFNEWRRLIGPNVFFLNTGIVAVHIVRNSQEIIDSSGPGLYQTYIRADNLSQVLSNISGCSGPSTEKLYWPGWFRYFPTYISSGPEILDFRAFTAGLGGMIAFELSVPGNDRGLLHISVQSNSGLKDVSIYDGEKLFQKFILKGDTYFDKFITIHPDSYHCYSMTVTDKQGRKAVSYNAFLQIQEKVHMRCGDNWNWMATGKGPGSLDPPDIGYQLHEVTHGWESKKWEPGSKEKEKQKRSKYQCEQGFYSHGGLSAATNRYIHPAGFLVDDKPWNAYYSAITMNFDTIGWYGIIVTNTVRDDSLVRDPEPYTYGCFSGPYKVNPSPWPADLKQFVPMQKPDGAVINRYQGKVTFTKKVSSSDGKPISVFPGVTSDPTANIVEVMNADGTSKRHEVGGSTISGEIPVGGYICWYDDKGDGVGGIIALSSGIHYSYTKKWQECYIDVASPVQPGTEVNWDVIFVTGNRSTSNSNEQMLDVWKGMGIVGKPTLYKVEPKIGKVTDQEYFLTLGAEDYGFSGKIIKTSKKLLPIHLPVFIKGVNPRWAAGIWYKGETRLHTSEKYRDPWGASIWRIVAKYVPRIDEVKYIPVIEDGIGYCQIETDQQDPDVFIGNFLVCDNVDVFIRTVKIEKGRCIFEINNPTDKEITCTVRPSKGFDLTGKWQEKIILSPGGHKTITIR